MSSNTSRWNGVSRRLGAAVLAGAAIVPTAGAEPVHLTVDPAASNLSVTIAAAGASDTQSSSITGSFDLCLNVPSLPTVVTVDDFSAALSSNLNFSLNYGLLGSISATVSGAQARYATPGVPTGPVPVDAGSFSFVAPHTVPTDFLGSMHVVGSGFIGAPVGDQTVNLADFGPFDAQFDGRISNDGATLTVTGTVLFAGSNSDLGVTVTTTGTLTVTARAPLPAGGCPCDVDCTPGVDVFDLLTYLEGWFAGDPVAETTGDDPASIDVFDLLNYLDCWFAATGGAGCA